MGGGGRGRGPCAGSGLEMRLCLMGVGCKRANHGPAGLWGCGGGAGAVVVTLYSLCRHAPGASPRPIGRLTHLHGRAASLTQARRRRLRLSSSPW